MQPKKVLIVEDSKLLHKMYEVLLRKVALIHAHDGREALDRLAEHPDVDLILLDINMPRMNGLELLGALKKHTYFAAIPVVIVSTEGKDDDTRRALEAGAAGYIKKPFRNEALMVTIERLKAPSDRQAAGGTR